MVAGRGLGVVGVGGEDGAQGLEGALGAGIAFEEVDVGEVEEEVTAVEEGAEGGVVVAQVGDVEGEVHAHEGVRPREPAAQELEGGARREVAGNPEGFEEMGGDGLVGVVGEGKGVGGEGEGEGRGGGEAGEIEGGGEG